MNCDAVFIKGNSHSICQDYARAGQNYVLLSDGCSSSPDTDFGARLICKTAENLILHNDLSINEHFPYQVIQKAKSAAEQIHLAEQSLDATFLAAIVIGDSVHVYCAGDAMLAFGFHDDRIHLEQIQYQKSYPFYLNYLCNNTRLQSFQANTNNDLIVTGKIIINNTIETVSYQQLRLVDYYFTAAIPKRHLKYIVLLSDGIQSFSKQISSQTSRTTDNLQADEIAAQLIGFKNYQGAFVQRRINKFRKDVCRQNISHYDDLSMAAIHF